MKAPFLFLLLSLIVIKSPCQTIGGNSVFNFLTLPTSSQLSALGGVNISNQSNDIALAYSNPALIRDSMNSQMAANFNLMYSGIKDYFINGTWHIEKGDFNLATAVNYISYGDIPQTDPSGNSLGNFSPHDYDIQLSVAKKYETNWFYGASIKFIGSNYGQFNSNALAFDFGINYQGDKKLWQAALVVKNMGTQLKAYNLDKEDLPFDVELGVSKKFAAFPLQLSLTAQHIHQFDINYADTLYQPSLLKQQTIGKVLRHFILAAQYMLSNKLEITAGYNDLKRNELKIISAGNGLTGFSMGVGVFFNQLQVRYARSYYQNTTAYNQLAINIYLNKKSF